MKTPVTVQHLFPLVDEKLFALLESLTAEEWLLPTLARQWNVKDIAAHLLDGNVRTIAAEHNHRLPPPAISNYSELVSYLNEINATWVTAMKRVSCAQLLQWLKETGQQYCSIMAGQDMFAKAPFGVAWAGENESLNWFHVAREYTEKVHHQLQIRQAVNKEAGLINRDLFYPFLDTFMYGLPHALRLVLAPELTTVHLAITGEAGGHWFVTMRHKKWMLTKENTGYINTEIAMAPSLAWKLFTKGIRPQHAATQVTWQGDKKLCDAVLNMVAVMA